MLKFKNSKVNKFVIFLTISMIFIMIVIYSRIFEPKKYDFNVKKYYSNVKKYDFNVTKYDSNVKKYDFNVTKIDWINYTFVEFEMYRIGPGEFGKKVLLETDNDTKWSNILLKEFSYNVVTSDKISLDRALPDTRNKKCQSIKYRNDLPAVSVIVVFHDEYLSFVLRTVHSIINRTPPQLLKEIILVDDSSTKGSLGVELEQHVENNFKDKVRILRLAERQGLMKARMAGVRESKSDIVVVMDAHIEVNINWLPPLIEPIYENNRVLTQPFVDYIDWNTLEYEGYPGSTGGRGAFTWYLGYTELKRIMLPNESIVDNYNVPVILGAIIAMNKNYFWALGGYDPGLQIWGGEQFELSWKTWMCGGKILNVPCSRIGHNYKGSGFHPYTNNSTYISPNLKRIAEVWMDEYKNVFYAHSDAQKYDAGDLTVQNALRKRLGCKSFKWFLETIAPDILDAYPISPTNVLAYGTIQSVANKEYCVDRLSANNVNPIGLYSCASNLTAPQDTQFFIYTKHNEIRFKSDYTCWDANFGETKDDKLFIKIYGCHGSDGNQLFKYNKTSQQITSPHNSCLEADFNDRTNLKLYLTRCDAEKLFQKWSWGYLNETAFNLLES